MDPGSDCPSGKVQYTAEGVAEKAGDYTGVHVYLCLVAFDPVERASVPGCECWHMSRKAKLREAG